MRGSDRGLAVLLAGFLAAGCGGGGGGGGTGPDVTPPPVPAIGRIEIGAPVPDGISRIEGSDGAVEGSATVTVVNVDATERAGGATVQAQVAAAADGSFSISILAQLADELRFTATDAAGNESPPAIAQAGPVLTPFTGQSSGAIQLLTFTTGQGAIGLPFPTGSERYTVVVQSLDPRGDEFSVKVTGAEGVRVSGRPIEGASGAGHPAGPEAAIRELERRVMGKLPRHTPAPVRMLAPAQQIGDRDTFHVANRTGTIDLQNASHFDRVDAALRFIGEHTHVYVDIRTPPANLGESVIRDIGERFDDEIYPTDRSAFGEESDIDLNDRVIILLTPTVNELNTQTSVDDGTVFLGFFFGIDLLPDPIFNPFANAAEIFYAVIPDPTREFSPARIPIETAEEVLSSIFAHEFEHMISANQHVLIRSGQVEAVWLDEGLAHMAETLNGFHLQNRLRSALFLDDPQENPLVGGDDTLERRGAAWLFVHYLVDRFGQGILGELVQTRFISTGNVDLATNRSFPFLFHEWASTLFLDEEGVTSDPVFDFPSIDVRAQFEIARGELDPGVLGSFLDIVNRILPGQAGGSLTRPVRGTAAAYFTIRAVQSGNLPLVVEAPRQSTLQVTAIRTE